MPLRAEQAVNPAILVADEAHVVQIRLLRLVIRHPHRVIPEPEPVHAGFALRHGEKRFTVPALDARHQHDVPVPFHRADVEDAVDAQPCHEMRIGGVIEIITPEQGRVFGGQHRKFIPVKDAVADFLRAVAAFDQLFMLSLELFQFALKGGFVHLACAECRGWGMLVQIILADCDAKHRRLTSLPLATLTLCETNRQLTMSSKHATSKTFPKWAANVHFSERTSP